MKHFADQAFRTLLVTYNEMSMAEFEDMKHRHNNFKKEDDRIVVE